VIINFSQTSLPALLYFNKAIDVDAVDIMQIVYARRLIEEEV
jgi:hypothetical protein